MEIENSLSEKGKRDLEIVKRARCGDQAAFAELLEAYREPVFYTLVKMVKNTDDAEDLTIEAFGKAFNNIHQYQPTYAFSTWLFRIASNNAIDFIRKKRVFVTSIHHFYTNKDGESVGLDITSGHLDPEQVLIKDQKIKAMRKVVEKLKPHYKELITKRYFEELSYEEIAETMSLPLGTVKAQLFRAREFLANIMKNIKDEI